MKSPSFLNSAKIIYFSLMVMSFLLTAIVNAQDTPIENKKRVEIGVLTGYGLYSTQLNNFSGDTDVLEYSTQKGATGTRYFTLEATLPIHQNFFLFSTLSYSDVDFGYEYLYNNQMTIFGSDPLRSAGGFSVSGLFPQVGFSVAHGLTKKTRLALKFGVGLSILTNTDHNWAVGNTFLNGRLLEGDEIYEKSDPDNFHNRPFTSIGLEYVFISSSNVYLKAHLVYNQSYGNSVSRMEAGNYVAATEESNSVTFGLGYRKVIAQIGIGYAF